MITTLEKGHFGSDEEVIVDDVSVTYTQNEDCVSSDHEVQTLQIFTQSNGTDRFLVLKTKRWAINGIEDLVELITDFNKRAGLEEDKKEE